MTRKGFLLSAVCALFILFASGPVRSGAAEKNLNVLASTFPVYLFASNICANVPGATVSLLIPAAAGCPHDFALRPQDAQKLAKADILVINGAGLEEFLEKTLKNLAPGVGVIDAATGIQLLADGHGHINPHIFAAPGDAALMARNIAEGLAKADSANGGLYRKNAETYATALEEISAKFKQVGQKAKNKGIAIEHDALAYLAANADLDALVMFEHGNSAAKLGSLKKELLEKKPHVLAGDSQFDDRLLRTLAKETGIEFIRLDPCASGPENPPLDYYQTIMNDNLKVLEGTFDN